MRRRTLVGLLASLLTLCRCGLRLGRWLAIQHRRQRELHDRARRTPAPRRSRRPPPSTWSCKGKTKNGNGQPATSTSLNIVFPEGWCRTRAVAQEEALRHRQGERPGRRLRLPEGLQDRHRQGDRQGRRRRVEAVRDHQRHHRDDRGHRSRDQERQHRLLPRWQAGHDPPVDDPGQGVGPQAQHQDPEHRPGARPAACRPESRQLTTKFTGKVEGQRQVDRHPGDQGLPENKKWKLSFTNVFRGGAKDTNTDTVKCTK